MIINICTTYVGACLVDGRGRISRQNGSPSSTPTLTQSARRKQGRNDVTKRK